jgi:hypothetical protein
MAESPGLNPEVDLLSCCRMYGHRYDVLTTYIVRHHDEQRPMFPDDHIPARNAIEVTLIAKPNDVLYAGEIETSQLSPVSKVICPYPSPQPDNGKVIEA